MKNSGRWVKGQSGNPNGSPKKYLTQEDYPPKKHCDSCFSEKQIKEFYFDKKRGYYSSRCKECSKKQRIEWGKKNRIKEYGYQKKYFKKFPLAKNTIEKVRYHIEKGHIKKPSNCSKCGSTKRIIAHHPFYGYENALTVIFLCDSCHKLQHTKEKE